MKKKITVIIGSASRNSANQKLIDIFCALTTDQFTFTVFDDLKILPHFDPELSKDNPPPLIQSFRNEIANSAGVVICTPEYVFSIPSGLKNAIEWCVAATVFTEKPLGLITASADGQTGHQELQLIMRTIGASFTDDTTLLIRGIRGKINDQGELLDADTYQALTKFVTAFTLLVR